MVVKVRRYLPARLLAKDSIISVLSKIKGLGEEGGLASGYCPSSSVSKNAPSWHVVT